MYLGEYLRGGRGYSFAATGGEADGGIFFNFLPLLQAKQASGSATSPQHYNTTLQLLLLCSLCAAAVSGNSTSPGLLRPLQAVLLCQHAPRHTKKQNTTRMKKHEVSKCGAHLHFVWSVHRQQRVAGNRKERGRDSQHPPNPPTIYCCTHAPPRLHPTAVSPPE